MAQRIAKRSELDGNQAGAWTGRRALNTLLEVQQCDAESFLAVTSATLKLRDEG
jgi:hypothetical protein